MLLLVDGSSYVYRAYHAVPDLRTSTGRPTGAIRGVISMLERVVEVYKPEYFAVVMDAPGKTFRHEWYKEYKAHRPSMPEDLSEQIPLLLSLIERHGWKLIQVSGVEADDVIATLSMQAIEQKMDCLISTGDKDLAQLVQPGIKLVNTMTDELFDSDKVYEKFGVMPHQIVDYLTLVGDAVDNVPGVPRVGPKTAAKWLAEHGSLDAIILAAASFKGATGEALRQSLDWLPQAKKLVTVVSDLVLPLSCSDCTFGVPDHAGVIQMYKELEFRNLLKIYETKSAASLAVSADSVDTVKDVENNIDASISHAVSRGGREVIYDKVTFYKWLDWLYASTCTAFDTETTSLDALSAQIIGISFAVEGKGAVYLPLGHLERYLECEWALAALKPWFESSACPKVCQHAKYDEHVLANYGIYVQGVIGDTLLQSYVLSSHLSHGLDHLASRYLGWEMQDYVDLCGKGAKQLPFSSLPIDAAASYACDDAEATLLIYKHLEHELQTMPVLDNVYKNIEFPVHTILGRMERRGILLDVHALRQQSQELACRLAEIEASAYEVVGRVFNLASPKQIQAILYDEMGLPVLKKTPTGQPSTDEGVLEELATQFPLPKLLLEHRTLAKLKSTYTDKLPGMVDKIGRVHTNYNQTGAVTGRLSSNEPNLQNIPIKTMEGRRIRQAFIAAPEHVLVSADYSQIELRIMAHLSGDEGLIAAFESGGDVHRSTASKVFGVPVEDVTIDQRRYIKAVNFGLMYGMSAFGLAVQLGIDRASAQRFIDEYFVQYQGVAQYLKELKILAHEQGYVETIFGRRLYLPDLKSKGPRRAAAERAAINAPMQGSAADLIKRAMIDVQSWLDREKLSAYLLLQVHDELVLEVHQTHLALLKEGLVKVMSHVAELKVPLVVDVGSAENWEAAH